MGERVKGRGYIRRRKHLEVLATVNVHLKVLYLGDCSLIFSKLTLYNGHIFHHCHPRDLVCVYVCAKLSQHALVSYCRMPYVMLLY